MDGAAAAGVPVECPARAHRGAGSAAGGRHRGAGDLLAGVAERIAEHGTATERPALQAVHDAARWSAPGAAAALVDWDGPETARLRAFGVLHGVALGVLGPEDRAWLLDRLRGGSAQEQADRVA